MCSRSSPYCLNCHWGAMIVFHKLCRTAYFMSAENRVIVSDGSAAVSSNFHGVGRYIQSLTYGDINIDCVCTVCVCVCVAKTKSLSVVCRITHHRWWDTHRLSVGFNFKRKWSCHTYDVVSTCKTHLSHYSVHPCAFSRHQKSHAPSFPIGNSQLLPQLKR